ncbi:T9SS type B sorting domain-containing protein [Croceivirga radicis]|uniref:T9SS type B sorting domain-containing protein n=1 Tax=Croceivirga radicis TaxID=1929488 RepID=UPI000255B308|nr:T9SS C-terminal target domain-containing protein [Croceivirga radicis]
MNYRLFILLLLLSKSFTIYGQNRANIWYFGYGAGLDFNSGVPVPLLDGLLFTTEGCASISDTSGRLLFYTDGRVIFDRTHTVMPNGNNLLGDFSSTHSAVVVPSPSNFNEYYVFTLDDALGTDGFRYSIVDMSLNGGLGDVTLKNIEIVERTTEQLAVYKIPDRNAFWILTIRHNSNEFMAFRLTETGLDLTPVSSFTGWGNDGLGTATGQIKFSLDGEKIALANSSNVQLFDFDVNTGLVSNPRILMENQTPYGVEFSPDSNLLYAAYYGGVSQFNLASNIEADMAASRQDLRVTPGEAFGSLQLGPDGKIYCVKLYKEYLDVIHFPNIAGLACDYGYNQVDLNGRSGRKGLPTFISNISILSGAIIVDGYCSGEASYFSLDTDDVPDTILWDFGDGTTSTALNPQHTFTTPGDYDIEVTAQFGTRTLQEMLTVQIVSNPIANTANNIEICHFEDVYEFDLSVQDSDILGSQDINQFRVSYFLSQTDLLNHQNQLDGPTEFGLGTTSIYAKVQSVANSSCYASTEFEIVIKRTPDLLAVPDKTVCDQDGDGLVVFDLTEWDELIALPSTNTNITYHGSQTDAELSANILNTNYTNSNSTEVIYFRVENAEYPDCYVVGNFRLNVINQLIANKPRDLNVCDANNDGEAIFDLSQTWNEIIGAQSTNGLIITYHETQEDADSGSNELSSDSYLSASLEKTIYVRLANQSNDACFSTTNFNVRINETPVAPFVVDWLVCDEDSDGYYLFNLNEKASEILEGTSGTTVSFYSSQVDATIKQNSIPYNYQNNLNPQTIYFRMENATNPNCFDVGEFKITVNNVPMAHVPQNMVICSTVTMENSTINLSEQDNEILNGQNPEQYIVSYHASDLDAYNNENHLPRTDYETAKMEQTIWARVQNRQLDYCYEVTSFKVLVNPLPIAAIEETYVICPDSPELIIDAGNFDSYMWQDGSGSILGSNSMLSITELGSYSVTVFVTENGVTCENTSYFEVFSSGAPEDVLVKTTGISDKITLMIEAEGVGDFEYSINGTDYQSSPEFEVFPGSYMVYVRDPLGCRTLTEPVLAVGYQNFFTPNGDGIHDDWGLIGFSSLENPQLSIFDRYGKLIKQLNQQDSSWDGSYLNQLMPPADYWFKLTYGSNEVITGHFSLKL